MMKRHIYFWAAYLIFYWLLIWSGLNHNENESTGLQIALTALATILTLLPAKISAVYIGMPTLVNKMTYSTGSWTKVILRLIIGILVGIILYRLAIHLLIYPYLYQRPLAWDQFFTLSRMLSNFTELLVPMLFFGVIWISDEQRKSSLNAKQMENEKLNFELQLIKSQTNPHFLFNTLNNIYGLSRKNDPRASEALLKLSQLLRYLLYNNASSKVLLDKEIKMLQAYIDLMQMRRIKPVELQMQFENLNVLKEISPGLLLPLVENAFKFVGEKAEGMAQINLNIYHNDQDQFCFFIQNSVDESMDHSSGGLGLKNLKRQLELEYPNRHSLKVSKALGNFELELKIINA
ncbi:MAG: histidine kinase [Saprospiraceae bacterium]|nr:histidine kinase [Saprospiraceae bacterium]MBK9632172.1 histidine kinase [Saprospiraceae bacterium]